MACDPNKFIEGIVISDISEIISFQVVWTVNS